MSKEYLVEIDKGVKGFEQHAEEAENSMFLREVEKEGKCEECNKERKVLYLKRSNQAVGICKKCFQNFSFVIAIYEKIPENKDKNKNTNKDTNNLNTLD